MSCERLRIFFNKENFYYSQELVNPYEFYSTFYQLSKVFRIIDNEPIPKWTIITPLAVCFCGFFAALLSFLALVQFIIAFEVPLITESGTYFIIMVYKLLIFSCTITDGPHYRNFLQAMREDFNYICTKGNKYRERYFQNHLWTWKASIVSSLFIGLMAFGMVICANIELVFYFLNHEEGAIKPLPFPFWLFGLDTGKSPTHEIIFVFSNMCVLTHTSTYIFMMQTQIIWIRQIMSKADVIIWSLEELLTDVRLTSNKEEKEYYSEIIKARMRAIVEMHLSMYRLLDDYSGVYKKLLMFEQKLCAPVVCLTSFCAVEKLESGEFPGILLLLLSAVVIVVLIPSYMCTVLAEKVQSIGDACWTIPFWNAPGTVIRPYLLLIMQRSLRPLPIQAPGFESVSLETFSNKIAFAYSCFNMLRQSHFEVSE